MVETKGNVKNDGSSRGRSSPAWSGRRGAEASPSRPRRAGPPPGPREGGRPAGSIELSSAERAVLEGVFATSVERRLRDRCQAILMASRGRSQSEIAVDLSVTERSVRRWVAAYRENGLEGLEPGTPPGKPPLLNDSHVPTIAGWVERGPEACGVGMEVWTYSALARHVTRRLGISIRETAMRRFCLVHGIQPR